MVFNDLFNEVRADRTVVHGMDITPPQRARSTSGEIRLLQRARSDQLARLWSVALRGRNLARGFGGDFYCEYSSPDGCDANPGHVRTSIDIHRALPEPDYFFAQGSEDHVRQLGLGVSFEQRWIGRGSISFGAQKVDYRRSISAPSVTTPGLTTTTRNHSTPVLANLRFTLEPNPDLVVYGGYTRGLADSAPAPTNAAVPYATAPATATWQVDAGVRYTPRAGAQLVVGVFQIQKAYFNLDSNPASASFGSYRQLGHVRHRGIEASATISGDNGLTSVLGAVWLRPNLLFDPGQRDPNAGVALGVIPLLLDAEFDYVPRRRGPWSAGAQLRRVSARPAGQQDLPAYWLVTLTAGYRTAV